MRAVRKPAEWPCDETFWQAPWARLTAGNLAQIQPRRISVGHVLAIGRNHSVPQRCGGRIRCQTLLHGQMLNRVFGDGDVAGELTAEDSNGEKQEERGRNACEEEPPVLPIPLVWCLWRGFGVNGSCVSRCRRSDVI